MRLYLLDDDQALRWSPFAETRPVGELRFGALLLRERLERWSGLVCSGHLSAPALTGCDEPNTPPCVPGEETAPEGGALMWCSRAAPALDGPPPEDSASGVFVMDGRVAGIRVPAGGSLTEARAALGRPVSGDGPGTVVPGDLLEWPWDLVERNAVRLSDDLGTMYGSGESVAPDGCWRLGEAPVSLGEGAEVGPGVVLDTRGGPIRLDDGVVVEGPARLVGPLHLGPGCRVFGGQVGRLSAGPVCKLRGEIDSSVLVGYVNKAHDGYLGHALLGRWVNLGALTTNSDLKNDYGPVRVELPSGTVDTGRMKIGVFLGDHVKTGIGTVLNTGAVVGAGCNVFGGGMPPKTLPPFSWAGGGTVVPFRWDKFIEVARVVMARRDQPLADGTIRILKGLWERTHGSGT
ncbi:MAG TPA: putative sugar nucleotidyl transferase [Longimicrobiales bacterium]|nr:putative sugar nucleotidyl transferase [Longimicrobiales bacterium]